GKSLDIEVGKGPKQLSLSPDGSLGMVSMVNDGGIRLFKPFAGGATLGSLVKTAGDPSGSAFVSNSVAVVANAVGLGYSVLDIDATKGATVRATESLGAAAYGVGVIPGTTKVLITSVLASSKLTLVDTGASPP